MAPITLFKNYFSTLFKNKYVVSAKADENVKQKNYSNYRRRKDNSILNTFEFWLLDQWGEWGQRDERNYLIDYEFPIPPIYPPPP